MDSKLEEILFQARWGNKAGKSEYVFDKLTEALQLIGALPKSIKDVEPPDMSELPPSGSEDAYPAPRFIKIDGTSFKESRYATPSKMAEGLVVHYTVSGRSAKSAEGVVRYMAKKGLGCMVMDEDGLIYVPENFDPMKDAAAHAGRSAWNSHKGLNDEFAGIEICNWGRSSSKDEKYDRVRHAPTDDENIIKGWYQPYTPAQEKALIGLCIWMKKQNPAFTFNNVCGHDEARAVAGAKGDKQDPGGALSMTMPDFRELLLDLKD